MLDIFSKNVIVILKNNKVFENSFVYTALNNLHSYIIGNFFGAD